MPDEGFNRELLSLLARHGVTTKDPTQFPDVGQIAPRLTNPIAPVASYIREIITSDREFDEQILINVGRMLSKLER